MKQEHLEFEPHKLARTTDPDTSHEAASSIKDLREGHFTKIYSALLGHSGLTAEGISDLISLDYVAVNRRLAEMERGGMVARTSERKRNRSGRKAIVWVSIP